MKQHTMSVAGPSLDANPAPVGGSVAAKPQACASFIRGFTLIEILVALAIVAVALAAGMRALAQSADGASTLKARTLALWVAQNRLANAQLADQWPAIGTTSGDARQADTTFVWRETVSPTPNPAFRKIEVIVSQPDTPDYAIARLSGYLGNSRP